MRCWSFRIAGSAELGFWPVTKWFKVVGVDTFRPGDWHSSLYDIPSHQFSPNKSDI